MHSYRETNEVEKLDLKSCTLCPRNCQIDRTNNSVGFCRAGQYPKVARAELHAWEEPCISGTKGSGTVFFSSCNLRCVFCQNHCISQEDVGKEVTIERLSEIFLELKAKGAHNINLVTPSHYAPQIKAALLLAKEVGLNIPVIYNTNSYENLDTIKSLQGLIDAYVPDLKYYDDKYALRYSKVNNYFEKATLAIEEMYKQVGEPSFDKEGLITKGVIIRHLMLPGLLFDSKKVIDYIYNTYGDKVYISIMNQYTPLNKAKDYAEINKTLNPKHYDALIDYALSLGVTKGFIQDSGTSSKEFVPDFGLQGV